MGFCAELRHRQHQVMEEDVGWNLYPWQPFAALVNYAVLPGQTRITRSFQVRCPGCAE